MSCAPAKWVVASPSVQVSLFILKKLSVLLIFNRHLDLFQEDGEHYNFRDDQLNFQLKIKDKSGVSSIVVFNEHFHIFEEGRKWVPYYFLAFEASLDATKLEQNAPFPLLWNETAAEKVCFLIDKQV
jgi:hypothetical protein